MKNAGYFDERTLQFKQGVLKPDNEIAYDFCKRTFGTEGKARVIGINQGTGAGKSVLGLVYAINEYASKGKKVLILVNSAGAFKETCKEFGVDLELFPNMFITSYHWWRTKGIITSEIKEKYSDFDFIFADEAHNGLSNNAKNILPRLFSLSKHAKIMAATATPVRHTGERYTFGPGPFSTCIVFDKNTLAAMMSDGRVKKPVACCIEATASMNGYTALYNFSSEIAKNFKACLPKINIKKDTDKASFIVFFSTIKEMFESGKLLKKMFTEAFRGYDCGKKVYLYNGCCDRRTDTEYEVHGDIRNTIKFLDETDRKGIHVICTCRALAEGYHKDLNGVILFQKTKSKPLFFQEIGRCVKADGKHNFVILDVLCTKDRLVEPSFDGNNGVDAYFYRGNKNRKRYRSRAEAGAEVFDKYIRPLEENGVSFDFQPFNILALCDRKGKRAVLNDSIDYTLGTWFANLDGVKVFMEASKTNWHRIDCPQTRWVNAQLKNMVEGKLTNTQYNALVDLLGSQMINKVLAKAGKTSFRPLAKDKEGKYYVYNLINDNFDFTLKLKEMRIGNTHCKVRTMSDVLIEMGKFVLQSNERFALSVIRGNRSTLVCCSEEEFENSGQYEGARYLRKGYIMDNTDGRKFYCNTDKTFYKNIFASLLREGGLTPYDVSIEFAS